MHQREHQKELDLVIEMILIEDELEGKMHPVLNEEGECDSLEINEGMHVVDIRKK